MFFIPPRPPPPPPPATTLGEKTRIWATEVIFLLLRTTWPYYSNLTQNCKFIFPLQRGSCVRALLFEWWSVQQSDARSVGRNQVVEINPKVERQSGEMMIGPAAITRKMNREPSKRLECRKKGGSVSFLVSDFSKEGTKERWLRPLVCQPSREMCISRAQAHHHSNILLSLLFPACFFLSLSQLWGHIFFANLLSAKSFASQPAQNT